MQTSQTKLKSVCSCLMTTKQSKLVRDIFSRLSWVEVMLLRELAWITWWRKELEDEGEI